MRKLKSVFSRVWGVRKVRPNRVARSPPIARDVMLWSGDEQPLFPARVAACHAPQKIPPEAHQPH